MRGNNRKVEGRCKQIHLKTRNQWKKRGKRKKLNCTGRGHSEDSNLPIRTFQNKKRINPIQFQPNWHNTKHDSVFLIFLSVPISFKHLHTHFRQLRHVTCCNNLNTLNIPLSIFVPRPLRRERKAVIFRQREEQIRRFGHYSIQILLVVDFCYSKQSWWWRWRIQRRQFL